MSTEDALTPDELRTQLASFREQLELAHQKLIDSQRNFAAGCQMLIDEIDDGAPVTPELVESFLGGYDEAFTSMIAKVTDLTNGIKAMTIIWEAGGRETVAADADAQALAANAAAAVLSAFAAYTRACQAVADNFKEPSGS